MRSHPLTVATLILAAGTCTTQAQVTGFQVIPPGSGDNALFVRAISGDASTIIGETGTLGFGTVEAYRWTPQTGPQTIGALITGTFSRANVVTQNGGTIYGEATLGQFIFTPPSSVTVSGGARIVDVNADGAVRLLTNSVVGPSTFTSIPPLPADQTADCISISADGSAVALTSKFFESGGGGYGYGGGEDIIRDQACRWTIAAGTQPLGFLPQTNRSFATSISENGAVIIGTCRSGNSGPNRPFRWTASQGMTELLPAQGQPAPTSVTPTDCSADGSVIACNVDNVASIWTAQNGFVPIAQILATNGYDTSAFNLTQAVSISDDGTVVIGNANEINQLRLIGWAANLTSTCANPTNPWTAPRTVLVAQGDTLPDQSTAANVSPLTVNAAGAALLRLNGDLYLASPAGTLQQALAAGTSGIGSAMLNDTGTVAATRQQSITIGQPPATETTRTLFVGTPGAMNLIAQNGDPAPENTGGGTLRTWGEFSGPLLNNPGIALFQTSIDGGSTGSIRALAFDAVSGGPLFRAPPAISITAPIQLHAFSSAGTVVREAAEGLLAGGPPPASHTLIAPRGGPAPGITGGTFSTFANVGTNSTGTTLFVATVTISGEGSREAVYTCAPAGTPSLRAATPLPVAGGQSLISINTALLAETGSIFLGGTLDDGQAALVKLKPDGSAVIAVRAGQQAPIPGFCNQITQVQFLGLDGRRALLSLTSTTGSVLRQSLATWGEEEGLCVLASTGIQTTLRPGLSGTLTGATVSNLRSNGQDGKPSSMRANTLLYTATLLIEGFAVNAVIRQSLPPLACGPADIGSTGGSAGPDGLLNNNDFIVYIDRFFAGATSADIGTTGGTPGADGQFNNNDFIVFIDRFFGGCV